jgi:hypothetical protein
MVWFRKEQAKGAVISSTAGLQLLKGLSLQYQALLTYCVEQSPS